MAGDMQRVLCLGSGAGSCQVGAMTRFEEYAAAVKFLKEAAAAIDQAHACMKAAEIDDIEVQVSGGIQELSIYAAEMAKEVETAECSDCGHALSRHNDADGCNYERGDVLRGECL